MIILVILSQLFLVILNVTRNKGDILYPGTMQSGIWLVVLIAYAFSSDQYIEPNPAVFLIVLTSCVAFTVGCTITSGNQHRNIAIAWPEALRPKFEKIQNALVVISTLFLILILDRVHQIAGGRGALAAYGYLHAAINSGDSSLGFGWLRYASTLISITASALTVADVTSASGQFTGKTKYAIILAVIAGVTSTSRTILLTNILLVWLPFLYFGKVSFTRTVLLVVMLFMPIALVMAFVMGKFEPTQNGVVETFSSYFVGPLIAFSTQLNTGSTYGGGEHTFRFLFALLHSLGIGPEPAPLVQRFVYVPVRTNLYTSLLTYYSDFGLLGLFYVEFLLGLIHGLPYRMVTRKTASLATVYFFLISLLPLFSIYSTETDFSELSFWIQLSLGGYLVLSILPRLRIGHDRHRRRQLELGNVSGPVR